MKKAILSLTALVVAALIIPWVVDVRSIYSTLTGKDPAGQAEPDDEPVAEDDGVSDTEILELKSKARENLNLRVEQVNFQTYWRKIQVPGMIVDRPGYTDQGITAPIDGVISKIFATEGDIVRPGDPLFSLRLIGQTIQKVQMDYHKAVLEVEIIDRELKRIEELAKGGIVPGKRIIQLKQDRKRQVAATVSLKQNLVTFGLNDEHIQSIENGIFVSSIDVVAPKPKAEKVSLPNKTAQVPIFYEIQELKVELGQQVEAGSALLTLGNHRYLFVKGHVFEHEAPTIKKATLNSWPVRVHFLESESGDWKPLSNQFTLRHLSSIIDPNSRTFDFFISLTNQAKTYQKEGKTFVFWRFRPGQRVRIEVPVERLEKVLVVPNEAVHRDGAGHYVFQQNGDLFLRHRVKVLFKDRTHSVLEEGGLLKPGFFIAQNSAATLNRILKSQKESGATPGLHVHADGTVHAAH